MAFYYSRRKLKPREEEEAGELNVVPYLDILMNLIIFMLLSINGLTTFGILNASAPNYSVPDDKTTNKPAEDPNQKKLLLSVLISKKGHHISSEDGTLDNAGEPSVPLKTDGTYDYATLNAKMVQVKAAFPSETKVVVAADPDIAYEILIQTMDSLRETPTRPRQILFPDVTLGTI
jgi:biopolymer transport protein TolR